MMGITKTTGWVAGVGLAAAVLGAPRPTQAAEREREIVVLYDSATATHDGLETILERATAVRRRGRNLPRAVRRRSGGRLTAATWTVGGDDAEAAAVAALRQAPGVKHVGRNRHWCATGTPRDFPLFEEGATAASVTSQPAIAQVAAPTSGGLGVAVAILDGGFDLGHEMLAGRFAGPGWDALDGDPYPEDLGDGTDGDGDGRTDDMVGHGTFVAGLVLSVAPDAKVIPYRVLDDEGWGTDLAVWVAVSRALDDGADVINLSLVLPNMPQPLQDAIDDARAQGVVLVTAAGNDTAGPFDDPDLMPRALTVGGVDDDDKVLAWSPSGALVEIYAPADDLLGPLGGAIEDSYATWSGTSFACALVSGAAAQIRAADSTLTPDTVEALLALHTDPVTGDSTSGRLDVAAALAAAP